jgi:hypothetical protein
MTVIDRLRTDLVELASLQQHVAGALGLPVGRLLMVVKSARKIPSGPERFLRWPAGAVNLSFH